MPQTTLLHGDCLDHLQDIPTGSIDAVITDPPFAITACAWDEVIPLEPMWTELKRVTKPTAPVVLMAAQPFTSALVMSNLKMFKYEIIWHKTKHSNPFFAGKRPLPCHESILVFGRGAITYNPIKEKSPTPYRSNLNTAGRVAKDTVGKQWAGESELRDARHPRSVVTIPNPSSEVGLHPTQKPLGLLRYLVQTYTNEGDTVLDFTMGSGTAGVACVELGRGFVGIERDATHYQTAQQRLTTALEQPSLFFNNEGSINHG